jgi:hypothetical protein
MIYTCPRCSYETAQLGNLKTHLQRKTACKALNCDTDPGTILEQLLQSRLNKIIRCELCSKEFKNHQGKYQHKKRCGKMVSQELVESLQNDMKRLQYQVSHQQTQQNTVVNNVQHNNIQNITINFRSFGQENINHIEQDKGFLTTCLLQRDIKTLIESIHCDKSYPENHNVRIKSIKYDLMETYIDGKWIVTDKEEALDELINKGYRVLRYHSHKNKKDILEECDDDLGEYDDVLNWLESIYENSKVRQPIKRQLLILFLNNKAMLLGKDINE